MTFFTADTHFGHKAVIEYCNRPFKTVEEMNEGLIQRWNERVGPKDLVIHVGDFAFLGSIATKEIISRLNGEIHLVRGNHDHKPHRFFKRIEFQSAMYIANGLSVNISHYPYKGFEIDERDFSDRQMVDDGRWLLHGHVHSAWKIKNKMVNVGVDQWGYAPVSEDEVAALIFKTEAERAAA